MRSGLLGRAAAAIGASEDLNPCSGGDADLTHFLNDYYTLVLQFSILERNSFGSVEKIHFPFATQFQRLQIEFLTSVSGHYSPVAHGDSSMIRSTTFKSISRTFGPFRVQEGTPFSFPMEGGQIVGFKEKSGWSKHHRPPSPQPLPAPLQLSPLLLPHMHHLRRYNPLNNSSKSHSFRQKLQ
ncbi:Jacalin-type lectin domain-containing protein [Forsythia ovata]|uniref:Jacalin-type lectin domain-containing protein n=1 Tax=Forsythia ovata TaxID=205694 RepID=A0ABD1VDA1_9LAMI